MGDGTQAVALNSMFFVQRSENLQVRLNLYVELQGQELSQTGLPGEEGQSLARWAPALLQDNFQMMEGQRTRLLI